MRYARLVREFNEAYGSDAPPRPGLPGSLGDRCRLVRLQLIAEEGAELVHAVAGRDIVEAFDALTDLEYVVVGAFVAVGADRAGVELPTPLLTGSGMVRLPGTALFLQLYADFTLQLGAFTAALATGDWQNVAGATMVLRDRLRGLWSSFHASEELRWALFREVHRSNMTKFGEDGRPVLNAAGRVVKGPSYQKPDLRAVLQAHGIALPDPEPGSPLSGAVLVDAGAPRVGLGRPGRSERHPDEGKVLASRPVEGADL